MTTGLHLCLCNRLKAKVIGGTETIRADRCENAPLISQSELQKVERGTISCAIDGNNMLFGKMVWQRYCFCSIKLLTQQHFRICFMLVKKYKKTVYVLVPKMIHLCNRCISGMDLFDQFVAKYRFRIRSEKWRWAFFFWSIDVCIVNSWIIFKSMKKSYISLLEVRGEVVQQVLK